MNTKKYKNEIRDGLIKYMEKKAPGKSYSTYSTYASDSFYLLNNNQEDAYIRFMRSDKDMPEIRKLIWNILEEHRGAKEADKGIDYYYEKLCWHREYVRSIGGVDSLLGKKNFPDEKYEFVSNLQNKTNVMLVKNRENGKKYVRKEYDIYNRDVFERLQKLKIDGLPELIEVRENGGKLITIEAFIEGYTLLESVQKIGVYHGEEVIKIALSVCRILKELHSLTPQLLHRDIKPSNIMIDKTGKVYLIDFNASKEFRDDVSEDTYLFGTQYFAAPEQLTGYGASSPSTDIYGLAATMSYLMTSQYATHIIAPGRYQKVLKKALEINPRDRYQTVEEFEEALLNA